MQKEGSKLVPLRYGSIGAGFIAGFHERAMRQVPGFNFGGVFALKGAQELAVRASAHGQIECRVCPTIQDLVEWCDVISLNIPNNFRVEIMEQVVAAAKKAGKQLKGVLCEKPLGRTVAEAKRLVELARELGVRTAYLENQIHMKAIRTALLQLAGVQKAMGPMSLVRSAEEHAGPHEGWFWNPLLQGGGVLSDMACHSIAVAWYAVTPIGRHPLFLQPIKVQAETALLKWGLPEYRAALLARTGVDYWKTPAEDFATGIVTFRNPETGQIVKAQFTTSWMYDKQGLRLYMDGLGPGYAFEVNSLQSPLQVFIGDQAATAVADGEGALEKATATRGLLAVQPNEADLYGYVDELADARTAFREGKDALLPWEYGLEIAKLCQAAYMSAEQGRTIDLTDPTVITALDTYRSKISQGLGAEVLFDGGKAPVA